MAVHEPDLPDEVRESFERDLTDSAEPELAEMDETGRTAGEEFVTAEHVAIYTIGIPSLQSATCMETAHQVGWQFLGRDKNGRVITLETATCNVTSAGRSALAAKATQAAEYLRELDRQGDPRLSKHNFEVRILRVPAVHIEAIWLKAADDQEDLILPFVTYDRDQQPRTVYRMSEFLPKLREFAAQLNATRRPIPKQIREFGKSAVTGE